MDKILIFGVGNWFKKYKTLFKYDYIVGLIDNNEDTNGQYIDGLRVYSPAEAVKVDYNYICIMAGYHFAVEMKKQLLELGVDADKIFITMPQYFSWKKEKNLKCISNGDISKNRAVYLSGSLFNGGGVRVGVYLLKILKEIYGGVTVVSPDEGDLKDEILSLGVDLIITPDVSKTNDILWSYISTRELIWINSIYYMYIIDSIKNVPAKIIWWLHNGEDAWKNYPLIENGFDTREISVLGVSKTVKEGYLNHNKLGHMDILPWYMDDDSVKESIYDNYKRKMVFAVVGTFARIKGQDVFLDAVAHLDAADREKAEFIIVGQEFSNEYSRSLHIKYDEINEIKWLGSKKHEDVLRLYKNIDVLVCPSREDMLPMVCAEAMMNGIPCIMSDAVGMVDYVTDRVNALVFHSEDYKELSEIINWSIGNREILAEIGKNGRKVFDENFSYKAFCKRLDEYI